MRKLVPTLVLTLFMAMPFAIADEAVIEDGAASISKAEFRAIVENMPPSIRSSFVNDLGERLEVINGMLVARKVAALADTLTEDDEGYWELHAAIISAKFKFMYDRLKGDIKEPDFRPLARERYKVNTEKYARIPEFRASSHILFRSAPGLDRTDVRLKANRVLEELRAGADFAEMVEEYSEDPGTKARGGSLGRYIKFGDPKITPPYSEALFEIENIGEYSEVTDSQFGVHIIRLDAIRESSIASYEQVEEAIIVDLKREFMTLADAELRARFNITDDLRIDGPAVEEILAPYKTATAE